MSNFLVVKSILGNRVYEELNKSLLKLKNNSKVDLKDLHAAMDIVPKSIIAFVIKETSSLKDEETKEVDIPWDESAILNVTKRTSDVYDGYIKKGGHITHNFASLTIPLLAAHIMTEFELYDIEESSEESRGESSKISEHSQDDRQDIDFVSKFAALEAKIDALISFIASQKNEEVSMTKEAFIKEHENLIDVLKNPSKKKLKDEAEEQTEELKDEIKKSENSKLKFIKSLSKLKKAGLAPKMPSPPSPGTKVGGQSGISQKGLLGDKTEHSDSRAKPTMHMQSPYLKVPDQKTANSDSKPKPTIHMQSPYLKVPDQKTAKKSEKIILKSDDLKHNCIDCGKPVSSCSCFSVLSKPEIKQDKDKAVVKFKSDWDKEAVMAFYKSIQKAKNVRR